MAYSKVGIVNLAGGRIGIKPISSLSENADLAIRANAVWEYVLDEVLEAKDWTFAKFRSALEPSATTPENNWDFAYPLPEGFLRLVKHKKTETKDDPPFYPTGYDYIIECLSDGTKCIFTDYDAEEAEQSPYVTYIKRIADVSKFSANFINALSFRLAAEIALNLSDSPMGKYEAMMKLYQMALQKAEGVDRASDYQENAAGSTAWKDAGR